ncbi:MAG: PIG-L family deacetylase [Candidatus Roizmanbacteria bacterium]|nr:PIG-L family deacetylase [Candidatus Roizmanbacteria bacterium]
MRKTAFVILAHPDDESFGPGGTIALLSQTHDVYLFCATKGEAGQDYSEQNGMSLTEKRVIELQEASAILGVKEVIFLGYEDGRLSNSVYHEIADKITVYVNKLQPDRIITYEPRGISGHLDHIAMSMISSFIYIKNECIRELHYLCLDEKQRGQGQEYFIYFPPGYSDSEITKRVDIIPVLDKKIAAIKKHSSQIKDVEQMLKRHKDNRIEECFIILKK